MSDAVEIPLVEATNETLKGYGYLIDPMKIVTSKLLPGQNKGGVKLMKEQEMKEVALRDLLMRGGKEVLYTDKIMQSNTIVIMKWMENIY